MKCFNGNDWKNKLWKITSNPCRKAYYLQVNFLAFYFVYSASNSCCFQLILHKGVIFLVSFLFIKNVSSFAAQKWPNMAMKITTASKHVYYIKNRLWTKPMLKHFKYELECKDFVKIIIFLPYQIILHGIVYPLLWWMIRI